MTQNMEDEGAQIIVDGYLEDKDYPGSVAVQYGELLKFTRATSSPGFIPAGAVAVTAKGVGVAAEAKSASAAAGKIKMFGNPDKEFKIKFKEIELASVVTATTGTTTDTIRVATMDLGEDDVLIGAQVSILSCAADATQVGQTYTVTDYVQSTKDIVLNSSSVAFASGDTFKFTKMGRNAIEALHFGLYYVNGSTDDEGTMLQIVGAAGANFCKINELDSAGTTATIVLTSHYNRAQSALRTA